jgi:hypothetical protein
MENAALSNVEKMIVQLPFSGFYESVHDQQLDSAMELDAYNFSTDTPKDASYPEAVGMDESDLCEIMSDMADWSKAHEKYARDYVLAFAGYVKQETGVDLGMEFEKLESPREYNFGTDRIFAYIPVSVLGTLKAAVTLGNLAEVIKERHESRSGFCSFYTTDIESWNAKPLADWDHNELETLLIAWMRQEIAPDADETIDDKTIDYNPEMNTSAWQECVNWNEFDEKCAEYKAKNKS